jgi:hypothetical protein
MSPNPDIALLQKHAAALSQSRDELSALFLMLQTQLDAVKADNMPQIKQVARRVARQHGELVDLIKAHPDLFVQPRSYVVEGIKFGMQNQKGSLEWEDDAKVCKAIRRLADLGELTDEQVTLLIDTTEKPVATTLRQLDPKLLKKLGVSIEGEGDAPLVKSVDSSIEKAVTAVINAAIKEANAEMA